MWQGQGGEDDPQPSQQEILEAQQQLMMVVSGFWCWSRLQNRNEERWRVSLYTRSHLYSLRCLILQSREEKQRFSFLVCSSVTHYSHLSMRGFLISLFFFFCFPFQHQLLGTMQAQFERMSVGILQRIDDMSSKIDVSVDNEFNNNIRIVSVNTLAVTHSILASFQCWYIRIYVRPV